MGLKREGIDSCLADARHHDGVPPPHTGITAGHDTQRSGRGESDGHAPSCIEEQWSAALFGRKA
jgi:hypothetical protein